MIIIKYYYITDSAKGMLQADIKFNKLYWIVDKYLYLFSALFSKLRNLRSTFCDGGKHEDQAWWCWWGKYTKGKWCVFVCVYFQEIHIGSQEKPINSRL